MLKRIAINFAPFRVGAIKIDVMKNKKLLCGTKHFSKVVSSVVKSLSCYAKSKHGCLIYDCAQLDIFAPIKLTLSHMITHLKRLNIDTFLHHTFFQRIRRLINLIKRTYVDHIVNQ